MKLFKMFFWPVIMIIAVFAVIAAYLYLNQHRMIFFPSGDIAVTPTDVNLSFEDMAYMLSLAKDTGDVISMEKIIQMEDKIKPASNGVFTYIITNDKVRDAGSYYEGAYNFDSTLNEFTWVTLSSHSIGGHGINDSPEANEILSWLGGLKIQLLPTKPISNNVINPRSVNQHWNLNGKAGDTKSRYPGIKIKGKKAYLEIERLK